MKVCGSVMLVELDFLSVDLFEELLNILSCLTRAYMFIGTLHLSTSLKIVGVSCKRQR